MRSSNLSDLIVFLFIQLYFFSIAFWNPDPQHDGIQFVSAVAVTQGKIPHRDFFEQYGPVNAIFHSMALSLFGKDLYVLRFETLFILALTSLCLFYILRMTHVKFYLRALLLTIWALSCPVTSLSSNIYGLLPWPSLFTQFMTLLLICIFLKISENTKFAFSSIFPSLIGLIVILVIFTRFQVGISLMLIVSYIIKHLNIKKEIRERIHKKYANSLLVYFLATLFIGILTKSLIPFYDQILIGPFGTYVKEMNWPLFIGYLKTGLPLGLLIFGMLYVKKGQIDRRAKILIYSTLIFSGAFLQYLGTQNGGDAEIKLPSVLVSYFLGSQLSFMSVGFLFGFLSLICFGLEWLNLNNKITYMFIKEELKGNKNTFFSIKAKYRKDTRKLSGIGIITLSTIPGLALLYPLPSIYHFWWSFGISLLPVGIWISTKSTNRWKQIGVSLIMAPTLVSLLFFWNNSLQREWINLDFGVFKHMKVDPVYFESYKAMNQFLSKSSQEEMSSICFESMFISWNGNYNSSDPKHVSWAFGTNRSVAPAIPSRRILCSSDVFAQDFALKNKVRIVDELEYSLSWWSSGKMFEYVPVR